MIIPIKEGNHLLVVVVESKSYRYGVPTCWGWRYQFSMFVPAAFVAFGNLTVPHWGKRLSYLVHGSFPKLFEGRFVICHAYDVFFIIPPMIVYK